MTALNKHAELRQLATDAHELGLIKRYTKGIEANKRFAAIATPLTFLALLDELEAAQHEKDELQQGFIANQEEAHEAIKYATELKEQLARACAGREEAFSEVDEMQKSLDHTHRRRAIWRGRAEEAQAKLEAAERRIAELEAREVTLPDRKSIQFWPGDASEFDSLGYEIAVENALTAAGIGVKGE
ncbi:TPA: hypothetical protein R4Y25_001300 [Citrobacter freundii]|uniref:hypothetical protein n=2 Tax=Citrobacter freundii TaxID=546 RepID=UPI00103FEA93|nr:hypothetical protein [Citrobacter freundii]MDT3758481.1 hypothetical protein [Citrobacter freundii complex sp. 2023EL-00962]TCC18551.1 hypothetical protein EY921_07610 [Citrobacter freundii]HCL6005860.1 hypothetical protein [Citrobacter freundii]HED2388380.1 hypothetical protein [Citrobacter freundii]HED2401159.1 hypothetical protein [Citrobacter freundii]